MNNCGECNECCICFEVKELNKPKHEPCSNICEKGCSIYNARPKRCKDFVCDYIKSDWEVELRPDKCGVIIANFKDIYAAFRLKDSINLAIIKKIKEISVLNSLKIEGIDARPPVIN